MAHRDRIQGYGRWLVCVGIAVVGLGAAVAGGAARSSEPVDFERDIWPILADRCVTCHGPLDDFGKLRLDSMERILKGGDRGKALVPGKPEESLMYTRVVLPPDDLDVMPVEGEPLDKEQTELIRRWILEGADFGKWTEGESE
jgi:mono/diheme cytochrome c family protein